MLYQKLRKETIISKPKTFEWFKNELQKNKITNIEFTGNFKNMSTNISVRCKICGNQWNANPQHLLKGHCCKVCGLKRRDCKRGVRKTTEEFRSEMAEINPNIEILGEYITAKNGILCKCRVCNYNWSPRPTNLLSGCGCPKCGDKATHNKQVKREIDFITELKSINPTIRVTGKYINTHTNVRCKCSVCGNEWSAMPSNLLRGTGCPAHIRSHGEEAIIRWLDKHNIDYIPQKRFTGLVGVGGRTLPYDFFIPSHNTLIEYQGNFHDNTDRRQTEENFAIRVCHDKRKKDYALNNRYIFLEIWYYENIEEKLQEAFDITNPVTTTVA